MLDDTIKSNVAFGVDADRVDDESIWEVLRMAQIAEFVRSLPEGLSTHVGDRGVRISGGQRQRVGIARALWHNPDVLIFDEATSSLDTETEAELTRAIDSLQNKKTIVIVAHRFSTLKHCDAIYELNMGRLSPLDRSNIDARLDN